ncbi:alpha/beta hydrolase [Bizionia argentinensis JUB59]|uniref:Alpha/beta hydrolase n=1 Tax=Bizionia argentinensis JUB59 TaxID=1046627 RepID=G2EH87_9FLAO|nr:alpha/beta hydrolase [Bizionia argentinensis]EGV42161.1 alpha/beta hydrolase [Bizionia argentinensis JUB59]
MTLDYKGTSVFYTDQGQGTPIVLLHGFLENSTMWRYILPELIKTNRVITIDLLGHGQTGCLGYIHSMEVMAKTVHAVLNSLHIDKSIFIGHSMGGYVALAFAEQFPHKVLKLCLANSTCKEDSSERKKNRDRAILAVKKNYTIFVRLAVANLFTVENQSILEKEITFIKGEALKTPLQGIIAALEGMKIRLDQTAFFKKANFPKLMIIGRKDSVIEYKNQINEAIETNSTYVVFPDGHMSHIENKSLFLNKIMHFIE